MMTEGREKVAVVMFNLGGPDTQEAVKPFLFNLFNDPAIIRVPNPFRWLLAKVISARRAPIAREIYQQMGGGSPIVPLTQAQALAVEELLAPEVEAKCFLAMRYWHPFSLEAAQAVKEWGPDRIVMLSLYPQYSTTTTASSLKEWGRAARRVGLNLPTETVCCYPVDPGFVRGQAALIRPKLEEAAERAGGMEKVRLLLSAHGLPKRVVDEGDPYQKQVQETCAAVVEELNIPGLDWLDCYQSRVGPLEWIGPSTEDEIVRAGKDQKALVVVPIAFVTEHSETLVELDIEYGELAAESGVVHYLRVPAIGTQPDFMEALAGLVRTALNDHAEICHEDGICQAEALLAGKA